MSKLLIGPYIGNFKYEIEIFIPYVNYLLNVLDLSKFDDIIISSHINRKFLYKYPHTKFYPVYENITRNELDQEGIVFNGIDKQQYLQIAKMIKSDIGGVKEQQMLSYIKNTNNIPRTQLIYNKFEYKYTKTDNIIFIPDKSKKCRELYDWLSHNNIKFSVIGNMNNGLAVYNDLLKKKNYFDIVYEYMFNGVHNSKFVLTPCSEWALICNLQKIPVLYWGDKCSLFKKNGMLWFNNKNNISIRNFNLSMIKYMLKGE